MRASHYFDQTRTIDLESSQVFSETGGLGISLEYQWTSTGTDVEKGSTQSQCVQNGPQHYSICMDILWHPINISHCGECQTPGWLIVVLLCTPLLRAQPCNDRKDTQMNNACLYQPILQAQCSERERDEEIEREGQMDGESESDIPELIKTGTVREIRKSQWHDHT